MRDIDDVFAALSKSTFRNQFQLQGRDREYLKTKGLATVIDHARDFIGKRLAPKDPANDGRQTPYRGHPVFVAQHATACCCRGCLEKWHRIPKGRVLTAEEVIYIVAVLARWLRNETDRNDRS